MKQVFCNIKKSFCEIVVRGITPEGVITIDPTSCYHCPYFKRVFGDKIKKPPRPFPDRPDIPPPFEFENTKF